MSRALDVVTLTGEEYDALRYEVEDLRNVLRKLVEHDVTYWDSRGEVRHDVGTSQAEAMAIFREARQLLTPNMELTSKNKHGGARKGAGRKPVDTVEHRVRLPRDMVSVLTALGGGRLSRGIVLAADQLRVGGTCKKAPDVDSTGRSA